MIEIKFKIEREVVPYREDIDWGMYGCQPLEEYLDQVHLNKYGNISVKGKMPKLERNVTYRARLKEEFSKEWGYSYIVDKFFMDVPITPEEQKEYVRSLLTEQQFKNIYAVYNNGEDIIEMMKNNTFDYKAVKGLGEITYSIVRDKLLGNLEIREALTELSDYGLSYNNIMKLNKNFTSVSLMVKTVKENPYSLTCLNGYGFKTVDEIALKMGIDKTSTHRIESAIEYVMQRSELDGHTYITHKKLLRDTQTLLSIKRANIEMMLHKVKNIVCVNGKYAFINTYLAEANICNKLKKFDKEAPVLDFDVDDFIARQEQLHGFKLTDQQRGFFHNFKNRGVNLLIGYAGTGKTTITKFIIAMLEELGLTYKLLSPTGKASKVFTKHAERRAWTVNKVIGFESENSFFVPPEVDEDVVIIDESSMCGVKSASKLLQRMTNKKPRIVFIGDGFQLASVECGLLLSDLQNSEQFAVTMLDIVWRQSEGGILDLVTKVRLGEKFIRDDFEGVKRFGNNCLLVAAPQEKMEKGYIHYFKKLLEDYDKDDIMVLSPSKKHKLGSHAINRKLQEIVNPLNGRDEIRMVKDQEEMFFRENDNVMNTENIYQIKDIYDEPIDIMNGDTGIILKVDSTDRSVLVRFDEGRVLISSRELDRLLHSACMTMHKSQGSSAKAVIAISDKSHTYQLTANLLYTAWSRPEEILIILCQPKTINAAMRKIESKRRNTLLCDMLLGTIPTDIKIPA